MAKLICPKCGCGIFKMTFHLETPRRTYITIACKKCNKKLTLTLIGLLREGVTY
jgi:ribosomal protein S27AE